MAHWFLALSSRYAFNSSNLVATAALPRMREPVGMVVATPAAEVSTSPPAVVKATLAPGARNRGWAEAVSRHTARVRAIKP